MVNESESLINVVKTDKPKMLKGLNQKGVWTSIGVPCSPVAVAAPPAKRRDLTRVGIQVERGKPAVFP